MADTQTSTESAANLTELVAEIVGAYVSHNSVQMADLPNLIGQVHSALYADRLRHDPRRVPSQAGAPARLSHGCAERCGFALGACLSTAS